MAQNVFERYEKKYLMTRDQLDALTGRLDGRVQADQFGSYTVQNIYYDTDRFDLIRASIQKPIYKEKLRLRTYGAPGAPVFLELKKKYDGVVYKRREALSADDARHLIHHGLCAHEETQILREIRYFLTRYPVSEKVMICYERQALRGTQDAGLRITFDHNVRFRFSELNLHSGTWGNRLLEPGKILMEIKVPGVFPLWLSHALSECGIFPTSFSKYGTIYQRYGMHAVDEGVIQIA